MKKKGMTLDQVKAEAVELLATISPDDLAIAEQNLLDNGYCDSCVDVVLKYAANNLWKD